MSFLQQTVVPCSLLTSHLFHSPSTSQTECLVQLCPALHSSSSQAGKVQGCPCHGKNSGSVILVPLHSWCPGLIISKVFLVCIRENPTLLNVFHKEPETDRLTHIYHRVNTTMLKAQHILLLGGIIWEV